MNKDNIQAIYNFTAQFILNGVNFVLLMVFTRFLSTDDYGVVSIFQAYALFFTAVIGLNVQGSIGTAFIYFRENERKDYLASIMLIAVMFFCVVSILSVVFIRPFSKFSGLSLNLIMLMLGYSFGVFSFNFANIKYVYSRSSQYSCLMAVIVSSSTMYLSWICIKKQEVIGLELGILRILCISIPYILCAVYVLITVFTRGNPFVNLKKYLAFCLPICLPLILHGVSQIVLGQTDKIMIQKILDDNGMVGIYSFIVTFVHILNSIYMALNNTWVPIYYNYTKNREKELIINRSQRYCNLFLYLCIGFMCVSPEFVRIFADRRYWGGIRLIPIIVMTEFFVFLYSFAVNYEFYHRKTKWIAVGTTAAAMCNIVLNALFIPKFKLCGAALATLVSYFLLFIFHQICANRIQKEDDYPYNTVFFLKRIVIILLAILIFYIIENLVVVRWACASIIALHIIWNIKKNKTMF